MKNKKIQYFANAAALILGAVLLTTCTVGLGDSVDTKSPKVSITYPPVQSIIKNTFTLRGTASDDNELVGVMITVTNTETDEVFDSYQATVDRATNTWSFVANRRNEDGSFEFEDGKYQIVATAVDGANRKTVASTTYEIDNTAPVLVLNRPGTVGPVGGVKPEVYGSELKLTGSANDDHALDLVSMRVFREDGTPIGEPLTYANVSGVGMEILLAKHYASPADADQQALTDRYAAIYDHRTGGTQNFYCLVDISDYAREYDPPANVASADNTRGNVSQAFWLYDGIYSRVFDKSGFGLTMSDLTSVLSGRYASVATAGEVREYLEANQQNSTVWSKTAVTFSLNPENSPYYEVVGYNALATNEAITAQASNGTNLTVRVSAGRDQRPLLSDTIRVYLVPCNANGAPLSGEEDIPLLDSIAELAGNTAAIEERNDRLSKTGNDYVISVDVGTREPGKYYIVKVEGKDQAGYEITDLNGTFGFQVIASGNPPVLVVNSPSDLSYISANSVNFEGTVEAEGGFDSLTATVRIIRLSDGVAVRNGETPTFTIVPSDSNPNWAFTLDTATDIGPKGLYRADISLEAANVQNNRTSQQIRLFIDRQAPEATITKVTPYYGDDYDSDTDTYTYTVNGTVDVTLSMTDNDQIDTYSYTIGGGTPSTPVEVTSPVVEVTSPVVSLVIPINTLDYTDARRDLPLTVTLRDRAGNEATVDLSNIIHIDQSTDLPEVIVTNLDYADQAGAADNQLSGTDITGTITDDDGVASIWLVVDDGTNPPVLDTTLTSATDPALAGVGRNKSFILNLTGLDDGSYRLKATAKDTNSVESDPVVIWFSYDSAAPTLFGDTTPAGIPRTRTLFSLGGTASDKNALAATGSIRITQSYNGGTPAVLPIVTITPNGDNTNCTWSAANLPRNPASLADPAESDGTQDGTYVYSVIATDRSGKSSTALAKTIVYDTTPPDKNDITAPTADPGALGVNALSGSPYLFRGEAGEPSTGVGVAKIWYQITKSSTASVIPEGESPADHGYTELATGGNWSFTKNFPAEIAEGTGYWLHVLAEDKAGNRNAEATSVKFDVDLDDPEVTETEVGVATMVDRRESFDLFGAATDSHGIGTDNDDNVLITVTQSLNGEEATPIPISEVAGDGGLVLIKDGTGYTWNIEDLPFGETEETRGNNAENGTYEYKITTTDLVGKTHTITRRINFDTIGPEVTFTIPAANSWQTSFDVSASGSATDSASVKTVYYYTSDDPAPLVTDPKTVADLAGWASATGTNPWKLERTFTTQGNKVLYVTAIDSLGNISADVKSLSFGVDTEVPQVIDNSVVKADTNESFTLTGTASDSNALHSTEPVTITQRSFDGKENTITLTEIGPENSWTLPNLPLVPGDTGNASINFASSPAGTYDGDYVFTITVKDVAGKTDVVTRKVKIDTVAPVMVAPDTIVDASGWASKALLSLTVSVTETGSGIDTIEYAYTNSAGEESTQFLSLSGVNWIGNIPLEDGVKQSLVIRAVDKAGNKAVDKDYLFNVDTVPPTIKKISPTGQQLTNLKSDLVAICSVTDELSGINTELSSVRIKSIDRTNVASNSVYNDSDDTWTITVSKDILDELALGETASVIIEANDTAGNTITDNYTLSVDQTPPTVTISSPGTGSTINKKTEIRGTASDAVMLATVDLYIEEGPGTGTFPANSTAHFTGGDAYYWSYEFNTEARPWAAYTGPVVIRVRATDEAGNTTTVDYTYTIDQESDRPRIRSSNVIFNDGGTGYPSTLQMTKDVIGTIEDDDGPVTSVEIWDPEAGKWVVQPMDGISYTYQSYGEDGAKILRFKITDAAGTKFITDATTDDDTTPSPKFEWGAGSADEYTYDERTYSVDTIPPKNMGTVYANRTGGVVFADTVTLDSNSSFGGTSAKFRLWLGASDDNGIDSIKVTIPSTNPEEPYAEQTLRSDTHVVEITDVTEVAGYTIFRSDEFDISKVPDGNRKISIVVTDNSGLESNASYTILVDNTGPDIDYSYPEHEVDQVFGNLTITGLVSDGGSGLPDNAVTYQIGYDYDPDNDELWKTASVSGASWSITDFTSATRIENYTRQEVASVDAGTDTFTVPGHGYADGTQVWIGADELPGGLAHSTVYFIRDATADTFRLAGSSGGAAINIITNGDASVGISSHAQSAAGNIWYLPVIIRALDKAGNEFMTDEWDYRIKVDPSGDKPTAFVNYPEPDTILAEPNPIVAGIIRMSGYAEDNIDVSEVYMQIDVNGDGSFTATDVDTESVDWYNGGLGKQVSGSRNWTQTINADGEFNPAVEGTRRLIMYRVRARDNNGLYGSWSEPHYFEVDQGVPKYDSLALVQGGRIRTYEPDMWLSGDWTLTGSIMDESNINVVTVGNTPGASTSVVSGSLATPGWFTGTSSGSLYGYVMSIPVNTETSFPGTQTSHSFTISATDRSDPPMTSSREIRINYDNKKPDVSAVFGGSTPIRNSSGSYELNSSVVEAESGFDRVMVVFHRPDGMTDGGRVYNPLYGTGSADNYTLWTNFTESDEGLPLMEYTGATRSSATSLTLTGISSNPYARKGYYLRIGGLYYRITDLTGDTITWEGDVDQSIVDFELVYAIAVDLLNTEVVDMDGDGIIEAVTRSGGTYDWSCSINSTNLPDGQMNIRYVAFDKAGNFARHDDIATRVENNPPLLAQVRLGTDLDGNGFITDGSGTPASLNEWNPPYSLRVADAEQKTATVTAYNFTAKDFMEVVIDVVGGNGDLQYSLNVGGTTVHSLAAANLRTGDYVEGSESTNTITVLRDDLVTIGEGAQSFVFSIWDSTETYDVGDSDDFKAELTVALTVDVVDEVDPVTVVSPFFWNDADENSLYANSRANGHIELEDDLPASIFNQATGLFDADPKVSGKISIRGTAYDDQRLTALWMYVGDTAAAGNFDFPSTATTKTFGGKTYYRMAIYTPGSGWTPTASDMTTNGWVFSADDEYLDQNGHLVSWQLDWNTAELDTVAAVDRYVRIVAEDKRATPNASSEVANSTGDVTTNNVPYYRMDVVPYIRSIGSGLSKLKKNNPSVYNRTALGRYPVSEDETITVSGFNLGGDQSVSMASYSSGPFTYTVNGVTTLNNENRNTAEYNQLPNGDNNPHLTDDVILDVWQLNSTAVHSVGGGIKEPIMKINPSNGMAGFAFANGVDSFSMANGSANSYTHWQQNYADYGEVAFGFDVDGRSHGITIGHDTEPSSDYAGRMNYITSRWGVPTLAANNNFTYNNKLRMESCGIPAGEYLNGTTVATRIIDTTRFQSPSLAVASSEDRDNPTLYLAYYDNLQQQIRFRWGTSEANRGNRNDTGFDQFYDHDSQLGRDGTEWGHHRIWEADPGNYSLVAGDENDGTGNTGNTAGQYVAIDVITGDDINDDVVTIVWYDGANLMYTYRYGTKDDTNASSTGVPGQWSKPITIFEEAGLDCAISVDDTAAHGVHIAAYDRNEGGLRYAYLPSYNADQDEVQTCMVDDYNIVGTKISITTVLDGSNNAIPYISYYMPSALKPKLAYLVNPAGDKAPAGVNANTEFTGAWEVTMIPTASMVIEDRVNVDLWRDANNRATTSSTGTSSSDATSGTVYGNGTNNPLMAYVINVVTSGYIETAQKK